MHSSKVFAVDEVKPGAGYYWSFLERETRVFFQPRPNFKRLQNSVSPPLIGPLSFATKWSPPLSLFRNRLAAIDYDPRKHSALEIVDCCKRGPNSGRPPAPAERSSHAETKKHRLQLSRCCLFFFPKTHVVRACVWRSSSISRNGFGNITTTSRLSKRLTWETSLLGHQWCM